MPWKEFKGLVVEAMVAPCIAEQTQRVSLDSLVCSTDFSMFGKTPGSGGDIVLGASVLRSTHDDNELHVDQTPQVLLSTQEKHASYVTCVNCARLSSRRYGPAMHGIPAPLPFMSTAMRHFSMLLWSKF